MQRCGSAALVNELLRLTALRALGLSSLQCERSLQDRAMSDTDARGAMQADSEASRPLSQRTPGTITEQFDESAIGRASAKQSLENMIDTYGVEIVLGRWGRNAAAIRDYILTLERKPSPGTRSDPRR
jgi:hypothetical protein